MALPSDLHIAFNEKLLTYEEDRKMPYINSVERMVIEREVQKELQSTLEKGVQQGIQQGIIEILQIRFAEIPQTLVETLETIKNPDTLKALHRQAIIVESVEVFQPLVDEATVQLDTDRTGSDTDS